jgi:hypothetical protein
VSPDVLILAGILADLSPSLRSTSTISFRLREWCPNQVEKLYVLDATGYLLPTVT